MKDEKTKFNILSGTKSSIYTLTQWNTTEHFVLYSITLNCVKFHSKSSVLAFNLKVLNMFSSGFET